MAAVASRSDGDGVRPRNHGRGRSGGGVRRIERRVVVGVRPGYLTRGTESCRPDFPYGNRVGLIPVPPGTGSDRSGRPTGPVESGRSRGSASASGTGGYNAFVGEPDRPVFDDPSTPVGAREVEHRLHPPAVLERADGQARDLSRAPTEARGPARGPRQKPRLVEGPASTGMPIRTIDERLVPRPRRAVATSSAAHPAPGVLQRGHARSSACQVVSAEACKCILGRTGARVCHRRRAAWTWAGSTRGPSASAAIVEQDEGREGGVVLGECDDQLGHGQRHV